MEATLRVSLRSSRSPSCLAHERGFTAIAALLVLVGLSLATALCSSSGALPPTPFGVAVTPDAKLAFVVNPDQDTVAVIDIVIGSPDFGRQIAEIPVGVRPLGIGMNPDGEDVLVANFGSNTISIIDVATLSVRKTLASPLLDDPIDVVVGPREGSGQPAFLSGTYHAFISNHGGNDVLVYESGPDGPGGIGYDDIIGAVSPATLPGFSPLLEPRGAVIDPEVKLDSFSDTIGCWVAHRDSAGHGVASLVMYSQDTSPGMDLIDPLQPPQFGGKVFEVRSQFVSTHMGRGLDVVIADANLSVTKPDRVYLSMEGGVVDVFDLASGVFLARYEVGFDIHDLSVFLNP